MGSLPYIQSAGTHLRENTWKSVRVRAGRRRKEEPRLGAMGFGRPSNRRGKQEDEEEVEVEPAWGGGVISRS